MASMFTEKKEAANEVKFDESSEKIEKIATAQDTHGQIEELSALEATAASKAAWLISITVSLGGLLFGM